MVGCEPSHRIFLRNYYDYTVDLEIECKTKNNLDIRSIDSLDIAYRILEDINKYSGGELTKTLEVTKRNDSIYLFSLQKKSTVLLQPTGIIPIEKLVIKTQLANDTIILYGKNRNIGHYKKNKTVNYKIGIIHNVTIIDLGPE
jgi:hypothetical protein